MSRPDSGDDGASPPSEDTGITAVIPDIVEPEDEADKEPITERRPEYVQVSRRARAGTLEIRDAEVEEVAAASRRPARTLVMDGDEPELPPRPRANTIPLPEALPVEPQAASPEPARFTDEPTELIPFELIAGDDEDTYVAERRAPPAEARQRRAEDVEPPAADDAEVERLERWVLMCLETEEVLKLPPSRLPRLDPLVPAPLAGPARALVPNPIVGDAVFVHVEPAEPPPPETTDRTPTLPLELYARVKLAMWDGRRTLLEALAEHDVTEADWRDNELRLAETFAHEAREGKVSLALEVRQAMRALRSGATEEDDAPSVLELERYAAARVAVETARKIGEAIELGLARVGVAPEAWERASAVWTQRVRRDPELARRVRRAVADARRDHERKVEDALAS